MSDKTDPQPKVKAAGKTAAAKKSVKKKTGAKRVKAKKATSASAPKARAAKTARTAKAKTTTKKLRVRQIRSTVRRPKTFQRTLTALGIRHHQGEVVVNDTPAIRGMLGKVQHLVRVTPEE